MLRPKLVRKILRHVPQIVALDKTSLGKKLRSALHVCQVVVEPKPLAIYDGPPRRDLRYWRLSRLCVQLRAPNRAAVQFWSRRNVPSKSKTRL